jgi:hypothetical protein
MRRLSILTMLSPFLLSAATPEADLRAALQTKTGAVTLPSGVIEISREIVLPFDIHDLEIAGKNTTIKAAATFRGRALVVLSAGRNIKLHDFALDGNRDAIGRSIGLLPASCFRGLSRTTAFLRKASPVSKSLRSGRPESPATRFW